MYICICLHFMTNEPCKLSMKNSRGLASSIARAYNVVRCMCMHVCMYCMCVCASALLFMSSLMVLAANYSIELVAYALYTHQ